MQDMSESERGISCCKAAKFGAVGCFGGLTAGVFSWIGSSIIMSTTNELAVTNLVINIGPFTAVGLLIAAMCLLHNGCSTPNNAVDIESPPPQEDTNLLSAHDEEKSDDPGCLQGVFGLFAQKKSPTVTEPELVRARNSVFDANYLPGETPHL